MKRLFIIMLFAAAALPVFADGTAVIKELSGKVELKPASGTWQAASAGDVIAQGTTISTGFGSSAVLEVGESVLQVSALTRMKLEELVQKEGAQTTGLFLRVGKVNAEVKRDTGLSHDFKLRSPSSTAAVRGTNFTFDGKRLIVHRGAVALVSSALAREMLVSGGESSTISGTGKQTDPAFEKNRQTTTNGSAVKTESSSGQNLPQGFGGQGSAGVDLYGNITITIE